MERSETSATGGAHHCEKLRSSSEYPRTRGPAPFLHSITNGSGAVEVRLSFASFGARRKEAGWSGNPTSGDWSEITDTTRRGFTFHEMLDNLNLIHMNGRVYDQVVGRFISADPYLQAPGFTQSFNRYSYTFNSPLSYTDPSGYVASVDGIDTFKLIEPPPAEPAPIGGQSSITVTGSRPEPYRPNFSNLVNLLAGLGGSGNARPGSGERAGGSRASDPREDDSEDKDEPEDSEEPQGEEEQEQCIKPDGTIGNDHQGTLPNGNVVFGTFDFEGYLLFGGGFHLGVFYDHQSGNWGSYDAMDLGIGLGGSAGLNFGSARDLSSFQGQTDVFGVGLGPVAANYVSARGDPLDPVAGSIGPASNLMPVLGIPASAHASTSFTHITSSTLPPCQ